MEKKRLKYVAITIALLLLGHVVLGLTGLRAFILAVLVDGGAHPVYLLVRELRDDRPDVRTFTVSAIAKIGKDAIPSLLRALRSGDARQREGAAEALGAMGNWQVQIDNL